MKAKKVSELLTHIHSHDIVGSDWAEKEIERITGKKIDLSDSTMGELRNHLGEFKGPERIDKTLPYNTRVIGGWKIAERVATALLGNDPGGSYMGRGFIHRACIEALSKAGY